MITRLLFILVLVILSSVAVDYACRRTPVPVVVVPPVAEAPAEVVPPPDVVVAGPLEVEVVAPKKKRAISCHREAFGEWTVCK